MYILKWKDLSNPNINGVLDKEFNDYAAAVIYSLSISSINPGFEYFIEEIPNTEVI